MRKFSIFLVLLFSIAVFSVNSPKQPVLFFDTQNSLKDLPENIEYLLNLSLYENLDSETNITKFDSRFSYEFYPNDNVYANEIAVSAIRILGLEKDVLNKYPLSSPAFEDIKTNMEKAYTQNGYDFSRNYGYFKYANEYFISKIGYPLLDSSNPLEKVTKSEAIKAIVKIFTVKALNNGWNYGYYLPMTKNANLVTYAQELNARLGSGMGVTSPSDVGYISVFEKYFLTKIEENGKEKIVPIIKLSCFEGDNTFDGNENITRSYFYSLLSFIFSDNPMKVSDDDLIPVRTLNNMVSYLPKSSIQGEPILFLIKKPVNGVIKAISPYKFSNDVVKYNIDNDEVVTLDNSKVLVNTKYYVENIVENTSDKKILVGHNDDIYSGKEFSMNYKYLAEKDEHKKTYEFLSSGEIKKDDTGVWIVNAIHNNWRKIKIPDNLKLSDKFKIDGKNVKAKWYTVNVETIDQMREFAEKELPGIPEKYKKLYKEVNAEDIPNNIGVLFKTSVDYIYRTKIIKPDYLGAPAEYFKVMDRLNAERNYATLDSLNKFLENYKNEYYNVNKNESHEFINYWKDVVEKLGELKTSNNAYISPDLKININITKEKFIQKPEDMTIYFWTFYGGKLVSFEPATHRLFTQKFVEPFRYSSDAYLYVKYKDGTVKGKKMSENGKELLYNESGEYLRDVLLWFQVALKVDQYGNKYLEIVYIIGEEI